MGRGRQKAKQTKVARELKYHSSPLDSLALQRELAGGPVHQPPPPVQQPDDDDDEYSAYSRYIEDDDEEDEPARSSRR